MRRMKAFRHIVGFLLACVVGVLLPISASVYDGLYRQSHRAEYAYWPLCYNAQFVGMGSALVGAVTGVVGISFLHSLHRSKFRDYVAAGAIIGAIGGAIFTALFNIESDPLVSWFVFIALPAASMALGFTCYWLVSIRGHES